MEHSEFVHLHVHSEYSILDGATKIGELVERAREYKMPALALTDHGNMFGAIEFYEACTSMGIKPIIGQEFYIAKGDSSEKNSKEKPYHLILFARDERGYKNLLKLSSHGYLSGFYYKPRIDKTVLQEHSEGLMALSSCLAGEIPQLLLMGSGERAEKVAGYYRDIFGKENFYFEIMDNGLKEQREVNRELVKLARKLGVGLVATNDVHYLNREDAQYHDVLLCIQTSKSINDKNRLRFKTDEFYFRSPEEMKKLFSEIPDAIRNTIEIAERCNISLELGKPHLPNFPVPSGFTPETYLKKLTEEGLKRRYRELTDEVVQRAQMELRVIASMGFSTYFLIVHDFIRFARGKGIGVGPGRGSAAGSIVAYALGITNVDPLRYGLLFERFLNPSRVSMPDIDIDFDGERRDEVINYVRERYGEGKVAQIITFGAMKPRMVVRDVARALDMSPSEADRIAKMIPQKHNITIEDAIESSYELKELIGRDKRIRKLFEISKKLDGLVRHPSTHAAGVVISPVDLTEIVPLYRDPKSGVVSTQYQAKYLEDVGLLKMDFLGLKNITVIDRCLKLIEESGHEPPDMDSLDLEDKKVYEMLSKGESLGVFQLESSGMQNLLRRLKPESFEDIIAILALYRPGPLDSGMVDEFIERRNGNRPIRYPDPRLKEILESTYGVIVYQEQVMEIARKIGGFSMAEADNLRKAMGKKKPEIIEELKEQFIKGAIERKVKRHVAEDIFEMMKTFGRYGFNKSHSTAYAVLAFHTAYLKAHYPVYYICSLLSGELNDTDKIHEYILEARRMNVPVAPPSINESGVYFEVRDDRILYALSAIKNVGENAAKEIVRVRNENGKYTSFIDFTSRVDLRIVNRRVIESLIKAGAMDCLGETRSTLFNSVESAMEYGSKILADKISGQSTLFGDDESSGENEYYRFEKTPEWEDIEKSEYEKEVFGFYMNTHPVNSYLDLIEKVATARLVDLDRLPEDTKVTVVGMILSVKRVTTKDEKEMAFLSINDSNSTGEVVVFPSAYNEYGKRCVEKEIVVVTGRVNGGKIFADSILTPEEAEQSSIKSVHILLTGDCQEKHLLRLRDIFLEKKGKCSVYLHMPELEGKNKMVKASSFLLVEPDEDFIKRISGEKAVERIWVTR